MRIDKSVFTAEELAQYEALIAKAVVDPEVGEKEMEKEKPALPIQTKKKPSKKAPAMKADDEEDTLILEEEEEEIPEDEAEKSSRCKKATVNPDMAAALKRLAALEEAIGMKEFTEKAKKYAPLGENEEDLAKTLYDLKKSNEEGYKAYVEILDKSLGLVEKSGLFSEIGKSRSGVAGGDVLAKVEAAASEIMKSDTSMTREQAVAKAWTDNPDLVREYDAEYFRG